MSNPSNYDRAMWADAAVDTFALETNMKGEELDTKIGDLLCDLMHLCALNKLSFDVLLENGRDHYKEEKDGFE